MKFPLPILLLMLGLTLIGCHHFGMYSATAEIQIRPQNTGDGDIIPVGADGTPVSVNQMDEAILIMQSPDFLAPIIWALKEEKLGHVSEEHILSAQAPTPTQQELDQFRSNLKFKPVSGTNILKITAFSELPNEAAENANAVADSYKAMRDKEEDQHMQRGLDSLREQIADQVKLVDAKMADPEYRRLHMGGILVIPDPNAKTSPPDQKTRFKATQRDLEQQRSLLDALKVRLGQVLEDEKLKESPIRILTRAVAPPE